APSRWHPRDELGNGRAGRVHRSDDGCGDRADGVCMIGFYAAGAMGEGEAVPRWNPLDAATQLTLSSNDRVCTRSSTDNNSWRSVRSVTSHHSGKWLAQCRINANGAANGSMIFGVGTSAASLNSYPGAGVTSWGAQANNSP